MALRSLTQEELERARNARQHILVARWMRCGRMSRAEIDEIRVVIGEEEYATALVELENPGTPDPLRRGIYALSHALRKNFQA